MPHSAPVSGLSCRGQKFLLLSEEIHSVKEECVISVRQICEGVCNVTSSLVFGLEIFL